MPQSMLGNTENLQWMFRLWFTLFTFGRIFAIIVTNFLIISLHIVCTFIAYHYQFLVFSIFQLDWRVKVNIIIKVLMKKLNRESLCQYCWLEGSSYHVIYISKFMNLTRYYFSWYSILYHKFNWLIIWCCHSTKHKKVHHLSNNTATVCKAWITYQVLLA